MIESSKGRYGLKSTCLRFPEILAQSVANISPTLTPVVIVPLVFASAGTGTWLAYLFATIGIMLVGANINQFARNSATPGSLYSYVSRGLGVNMGFVAGWSLLLAYVLTAAAVLAGAVNCALLLFSLLHWQVPPLLLFAVGCFVAWLVAYTDVRLSTRLMLLLELVSMALILVLGVIVMLRGGEVLDARQITLQGLDFHGLKAGLVLAIFSYVGFESATTLGEEARNPLKSIPRSVLLSGLISGLFFMMSAYIAVLGFKHISGSLADSAAPFNDLAVNAGLPLFGVLISVGAVISLFACTLASINAAARVLLAMSRHGVFHSRLAGSHAQNDTPHHALTLVSVLVFLLPAALLDDGRGVLGVFNDLSTIATYGFLTVYVLVAIAAPLYLAQRGQMTVKSLVLALLALLFMLPPVIAAVYPTPLPPADKFVIYFGLYLAVGLGWYGWLRLRGSGELLAASSRELELDHP